MQDHILIVDDDAQVTSFLSRFFAKNGYRSTTAASARELFEKLAKESPDLVVLDLILPDEDGLDVARKLQQISDVPIIMLSARNELSDRIVGLELGADDYVTKPYEPRELLARVRSVLRRHRKTATAPPGGPDPREATRFRFAGIELNLVEAQAYRMHDTSNLGLTSTEFALLQCLVEAQGDLVSRDGIVSAVYGNSVQITDRAIDAHMVRLRRKLALAAADKDVIVTVHGRGYRLGAEVACPD